MQVGARWLGEFVMEEDLKPGDLFVTGAEPMLALRISPAVGSANTLILVNFGSDDATPVHKPIKFRTGAEPPERVRRLGGMFRIEPVELSLNGLTGFDGRRDKGFALLKDGTLAIHFLEPSFRHVYHLGTGQMVNSATAVLLPPQRLLWEQGDDALELCRF
jgi:hypothetical protein